MLQKDINEKERIIREQNQLVEQTHRQAALSEQQAANFAMQLNGAERRIGELDTRGALATEQARHLVGLAQE